MDKLEEPFSFEEEGQSESRVPMRPLQQQNRTKEGAVRAAIEEPEGKETLSGPSWVTTCIRRFSSSQSQF